MIKFLKRIFNRKSRFKILETRIEALESQIILLNNKEEGKNAKCK